MRLRAHLSPRHLLFGLIALILGLRSLHVFYTESTSLHLDLLTDTFQQMDKGDLMVLGEELGNLGLKMGGPIYAWLSYPARLADNPVLGIHLTHFVIELIGLALLFYCPTGRILQREVRWLATMFLALMLDHKIEMFQNDTLMALLAIWLFATFLWAMRPGAWRSMIIPGALAGMAVLVHQSAVFILPILLLVLLVERSLLALRILAGLAGLAMTIAVFLLPHLLQAPEAVGEHPTADLAAFPWLFALGCVAGNFMEYPLASLGLLLVVAAWIRGTPPSTGLKIAMAWMVLGIVEWGFILAFRHMMMEGPTLGWEDQWRKGAGMGIRCAALNPAQAVFIAAAGWWFIQAIRRRLTRLPPRLQRTGEAWLLPLALVTAVTLCMLVVLVRADFHRQYEEKAAAPCMEEIFHGDVRGSRYEFMLFQALKDDPVALASREFGVPPTYLNKDLLAIATWLDRVPPREGPLAVPLLEMAVMAPRFSKVDLASLAGAKERGPALVIPGARLLLDDPAGKKILLGPALQRGRRRYLLTALWTRGLKDVAFVAETPSGRLPISPADRCSSPHYTSDHAEWYLFDLQTIPAGARSIALARGGTFEHTTALLPPPASGD